MCENVSCLAQNPLQRERPQGLDYGSRVGSWAVRTVLLCNPTEEAQMIRLNWNIELSTSLKYMRKRTWPCLPRCQHEAEHCHLRLWSDKVAEL